MIQTSDQTLDDHPPACDFEAMFRLAAGAYSCLSEEGLMVAEQFLSALPPFAREHITQVTLFGPQARRFDSEAPFDLLVFADQGTWAVKTGVSIAVSAIESSGLYTARATIATAFERRDPSTTLRRLLQNAEREGVELWARGELPAALSA
jgi:hypothetical protein